MDAHLYAQPPSARHERPDLPEAIDRVIERATAKWPDERYSTSSELAAAAQAAFAPAVEPLGASVSRGAPRPREPAPRSGYTPLEQLQHTQATFGDSRAAPVLARRLWTRRRTPLVALGLVILVAAVVAAVLGLRDQGDARSATPGKPDTGTTGQLALEGVAPAEPQSEAPAEPAVVAEPPTDAAGEHPYRVILSLGPGSLVRLDARTGTTLAKVSIPFPFQLAADGRSVWALSAEPVLGSKLLLARVDTATNSVTDVFNALSRPPAPLGLAVVRGSAWFSNEFGRTFRFSPGTSAGEPAEFEVAGPDFYWPVAAAGSLWVTSGSDLLRVDPATGRVQARIERVNRAVVDGKGFVWALGNEPRSGLVRIDTESNATRSIGEPGFPSADFTVADGAVWVSSREDGTITRLDPATGEEESEPIRLGQGPFAIAGGAGAVWAAISSEGVVARYDIATGRIETIDVEGTPVDLVGAGDSIWVAVAPPTSEQYTEGAEAICREASERLSAVLADFYTPGAFDIDDVEAFQVIAAHISEETLAELRALPVPQTDRAGLEKEYALREREIELMRQVAAARVAGDIARADDLIEKRVALTHERQDGTLPSACPVNLGA